VRYVTHADDPDRAMRELASGSPPDLDDLRAPRVKAGSRHRFLGKSDACLMCGRREYVDGDRSHPTVVDW
jgi:hypothetical protein